MFRCGNYKNNETGNIYFAEKLLENYLTKEIVIEFYPYYKCVVDFDRGYTVNYDYFIENFERIECNDKDRN